MKTNNRDIKYAIAKGKVEKLRAFYVHLSVYLIVNIALYLVKIVRNLLNGESFKEAALDFDFFSLWVIWGLALAIHAFATFGMDLIFGNDWERKRIKKYMEEEENNTINY